MNNELLYFRSLSVMTNDGMGSWLKIYTGMGSWLKIYMEVGDPDEPHAEKNVYNFSISNL